MKREYSITFYILFGSLVLNASRFQIMILGDLVHIIQWYWFKSTCITLHSITIQTSFTQLSLFSPILQILVHVLKQLYMIARTCMDVNYKSKFTFFFKNKIILVFQACNLHFAGRKQCVLVWKLILTINIHGKINVWRCMCP